MLTPGAYTSRQPESNQPVHFELTPVRGRKRKHLAEEVTRVLASIRPWTWPLARRLARTWNTWRGGEAGAHAKLRGHHEARLRSNLDLARRRNWWCTLAEGAPGVHRFQARAVVLQARRLAALDWCKPRAYVVPETGEVRETLYLPEDTWGAEHLLDWCIAFLERLRAAVGSMTDKVTRRYRAEETVNLRSARNGPGRVTDYLPDLLAKWSARGAPQQELPASS